MPADQIAKLSGAKAKCGVWLDNAEAVAMFATISSQWRCAGGASGFLFLGLDYTAALAGLNAAGMNPTPDQWSDIRVMEDEACAVLNRRS